MSPSASTPTFELSAEQVATVRSLASSIRLAAIAFFGLALVCAVTMVLRFIDTGLGTALLYLVLAALAGVTGLIVLTGADDVQFLADTKGYVKEHLMHLFDSLITFSKSLILLAAFVALVFAIKAIL